MNDLLVSLSAAGGVIVGALLASATWMIQGIKDWKSAFQYAVVAFLALFLVDLLVLGPITVLELASLTPSAQAAIQRWNLGVHRTVIFLFVLPFATLGVRTRPSRSGTVAGIVKQVASRRQADPARHENWVNIISIAVDGLWSVACLGFLVVAYYWGPDLVEANKKVTFNPSIKWFGGGTTMDVKLVFSAIAGATLTLAVQSWREWSRRRRLARACRRLLERELQMLWFDLTGMVRPESSGFFSRQTEIWDTYKGQLPDILGVRELERISSAYYWVKDFQYRASQGAVTNYVDETDPVRKAIVDAIRALGGHVSATQDETSKLGADAPRAAG